MEDKWGYCPKCGARRGADTFDSFGRDLFSQLFSKMRNSFSDMGEFDKLFEKDMEAMDLSPWFPQSKQNRERVIRPRGKGFSIRITRGTGMEPRVSVKTFGDVKKENIEKALEENLGVQKPVAKKFPPAGDKEQARRFRLPGIARKPAAPSCTEEPEAEVRRIGDKAVVDICMPGVR